MQIVKAVRRQGLTFPASPILVVYALIPFPRRVEQDCNAAHFSA